MTKQDKELLMKDLCARLPYGVKIYVRYYDISNDDKLKTMTTLLCATNLEFCIQLSHWVDVKPYLRPMSSMTDKERKEINELVESESSFLSPVPTWYVYEENIQKYVDFCLSHHLDWRGMIPKGLALEAPEGMYNF